MHPADQGKTGAGPDVLALAANDDHGPAAAGTDAAASHPGGWDPFEVWRTRVRDARRLPEPSIDE
jgi:hypothetical protein